MEEGKLKPNTVQILEGGLDGVPAGLKLLEENKVSNRKLVGKCIISIRYNKEYRQLTLDVLP